MNGPGLYWCNDMMRVS